MPSKLRHWSTRCTLQCMTIQREPHTCEVNKQGDDALLYQLGTIGMDLYVETERAALGLTA